MDNTKQRQILQALLDVSNTKGTMEEFLKAFQVAVDYLSKTKTATLAELSMLRATFDVAIKDLQSANLKDVTDIKGQLLGQINEKFGIALKEQEDGMNFIRDKVRKIKEGIDGAPGLPGKDADEQAIITAVLAQIPSPTMPDAYDDAEIQAQIDEHTKAIEELKSKGGNVAGWGAHPLNIYQSGTIKAETARHINFTGASVSQSNDGVTTVAISASGLTELVATGSINSSNTAFTFISKPTYLIIDGVKYKENAGWTWSGLTATTTKAPDFSIWGES